MLDIKIKVLIQFYICIIKQILKVISFLID
jgi:hypothetical protein